MNRLKKTKRILVFIQCIVLVIVLQGCERDDICAESTSTTPRLLIEFYDITNLEHLKSVPRLTVYGENVLTQDPDTEVDETIRFNINSNSVELPLRIGTEGEPITTRYILEKDTDLRLNDDTATTSNKDIIEISYTPKFVYVSRACGYKSIFNNLNITFDNDGDTWISNIDTVILTVENENTVHAHIFH